VNVVKLNLKYYFLFIILTNLDIALSCFHINKNMVLSFSVYMEVLAFFDGEVIRKNPMKYHENG